MPSYSVQTDSPANHNHGSAALHLASCKLENISLLSPWSPSSEEGTGVVVRPSALQCGGDKNAPQALLKPICVQYGRLFRRKMPFVSSTAKRQRGLQRGKLGSPLPCFASFCRSKRKAPAASRTGFAPCKIFATPLGDPQSCPEINIFCPPFSRASAYSSTATGFLARK